MTEPITARDETFRHERVTDDAPSRRTDANWQERCRHLLYASDDLLLVSGRAVWPQRGSRRAFLGIATGDSQHCVRIETPYGADDDADEPSVGALRIAPTDPLREVAIAYDSGDGELALALTFRARLDPIATAPLLIEQGEQVIAHDRSFVQSGDYEGWVDVDGRRHLVSGRHGARERGWGVRPPLDAPRRGLTLSLACELDRAALSVSLIETASGMRVLEDGWLTSTSGAIERVTAVRHDLEFDGDGLLIGGVLQVEIGGRYRTLVVTPRIRLLLAGVGASLAPDRQTSGRERFDLSDPVVVASLRGQTACGTAFLLDGEPGYGCVEVGLGTHERYLPERRP